MSRVVQAAPRRKPRDASAEHWVVSRALHEDVEGVVVAVEELLLELGGAPPPLAALEAAVLELIEDRDAGALLVARARGQIVGMLAASWPLAIHAAGRYALIQDLWVRPDRRSATIGGELVEALMAIASERGVTRAEVGLPSERFARQAATEAFYTANGFARLGPRMRRVLK